MRAAVARLARALREIRTAGADSEASLAHEVGENDFADVLRHTEQSSRFPGPQGEAGHLAIVREDAIDELRSAGFARRGTARPCSAITMRAPVGHLPSQVQSRCQESA